MFTEPMKTTPPKVILGLFARGREIGYALLVADTGELVRFGVKTIRGRRKGKEFVRAVEKALAPLIPTADWVVMEDTRLVRQKLGGLCRELTTLAERWKQDKICFRRVALSNAKQFFCADKQTSQRELTSRAEERFPLFIRKRASASPKVFLLATALAKTSLKR